MKKRKLNNNTAEFVGLPPVEKEFLEYNKTLYYNAEIHNDSYTKTPAYDNNIQATFTDDRALALLDNSSKYMMAIERFYIPGILIPIFNFDNTNDDYQVYVRATQSAGVFVERVEKLIYTGLTTYTLPPIGANFIFTYYQFFQMMRNAIGNALSYIKTNNAPTYNWIDTDLDVPIFEYKDGLITIYFRKSSWDNRNLVTNVLFLRLPYKMAMMFSYFRSTPTTTSRNNDYLSWMGIIIRSDPVNTLSLGNPAEDYILVTQEASSSYLWNDLQKIVFLTNTIPVKGEVIKSDQGQNLYYNLVTDFEPLVGGDNRTSDVFQYFPSGPRRWIDLQNNGPLITLNVSIVWQSKDGKRFPLFIPPGYSCSLKMVFAKRKDVSLE